MTYFDSVEAAEAIADANNDDDWTYSVVTFSNGKSVILIFDENNAFVDYL